MTALDVLGGVEESCM